MSKVKSDSLVEAIKTQYDTLANVILPQSEQFTNTLLEFHKK